MKPESTINVIIANAIIINPAIKKERALKMAMPLCTEFDQRAIRTAGVINSRPMAVITK